MERSIRFEFPVAEAKNSEIIWMCDFCEYKEKCEKE